MSTEKPKLRRNETTAPSRESTREELAVSLNETRQAFEIARAAWKAEKAGLEAQIAGLVAANEGLKSTSSTSTKEGGVDELQREVEQKLLIQEAKLFNLETIVANCEKVLSEAQSKALNGYDNISYAMTSPEGEVQTLISLTKNKPSFFADRKTKEAFKKAKPRLEEIRVGLKNRISEVNDIFNDVPSVIVSQNGYDVIADLNKATLDYFVNMGDAGLAAFHSLQDRETLRDLQSKLPAGDKELASSRRRVDALIERVSSVTAHLNGLKGLYDEYIRSQPEVYKKRDEVDTGVNKFFRNLS